MAVMAPRADPCILLHRDPEAWLRLLGERLVGRMSRNLGVKGIDELVELAADRPQTMYLALKGLSFRGPFAREWEIYRDSGYVSPAARARWPYMESGVSVDVRLLVSPCYLLTALTDGARRAIWRERGSSLFRWGLKDVPHRRPAEAFAAVFPDEIRRLARERGYSYVANLRWRDRRLPHLAEWAYWLDTGRMAHIDMYATSGRAGSTAGEILDGATIRTWA